MSLGADKLLEILKEIYGSNLKVTPEYHVGKRLRLDYYLPAYGLAFEFHGRQHASFVEHFHTSAAGFRSSKRRDQLKLEIAESLGITVITVWAHEEMTLDSIKSKIVNAMRQG